MFGFFWEGIAIHVALPEIKNAEISANWLLVLYQPINFYGDDKLFLF